MPLSESECLQCALGFAVTTPFPGVESLVHPPASVSVGYDMWTVLAASFLIDGAVLYRASNELAVRAALTNPHLRELGDSASVVQKLTAIFQHIKVTQALSCSLLLLPYPCCEKQICLCENLAPQAYPRIIMLFSRTPFSLRCFWRTSAPLWVSSSLLPASA